jgi:iron complex transport system ATP-binding protein
MLPLFEFEHVDVIREGRAVLHDLSLRVGFPEHVAIVGPNGAGKSTLLRLIARECYPVPSAATVCRILGQERWNVFALRSQLGIIEGDIAARFMPGATVAEVVASTLAQPDPGAVAEALERAGITPLATRDIRELSSGEWRRTTIARALVHRPRALVLDEPSSSLDILAQRELRTTLRALARENVGIILVTHHLEDVIPEIERVVFMQAGRVIADGPKTELFAPAPLRRLFGEGIELEERNGIYSIR